MKSLRDQALDATGVPSESDSIRTFNSLCSTPQGALWLEQAVDPMHDRGVHSASMPDHVSGRSVVQVITKRMTVISTTGNKFDALIKFDCDLNTNRLCDGNLIYDTPTTAEGGATPVLSLTALASARFYGGVTTSVGTVGSDLTQGQQLVAPWFNGNDPAAQFSEFPAGGYRLVGGSLEVYNTTPELYLSGQVTCYRQANRANLVRNLQTLTSAGVTLDTAGLVVQYPKAPTNVAAAQAMPDAVAMKASEGCYMPFIVNTDDVIKYPEFGTFMIADRQDRVGLQGVSVLRPISGTTTPVAQSSGNWQLPHDCAPLGAYFTGLSAETSLDVVVRFIVEIFPQIEDTVLMPLTRPSASADDRALSAYREIMAVMPIAVPVAWNGSGAWLRSIMKVAKPIYAIAKPAIKAAVKSLPQGQAIWSASNIAVDTAKAVDKLVKERKRAKKGK